MRVIINENFHVFVSQGADKSDRRVAFTKGMVVDDTAIPDGQFAASWIAKGLAARPRDPLDHDGDGRKGGSLPKITPSPAA